MLGLDFGILDLDLPETPVPGELPEDYVRRVAREKAGAGLLHVVGQPEAVVLGADTEVVLDGRIYGKPVDADGKHIWVVMQCRLISADNEVVTDG